MGEAGTTGILRTICLATSAISRIIKAHAFLANDPNGFYSEVEEAIRQVRVEMGLDDPPTPRESSDGST